VVVVATIFWCCRRPSRDDGELSRGNESTQDEVWTVRQVKLEHSSSINEDDHTYDKFDDHKKPKASETNEGNGNKEKDSAEYENEDEYDGTYIEQ